MTTTIECSPVSTTHCGFDWAVAAAHYHLLPLRQSCASLLGCQYIWNVSIYMWTIQTTMLDGVVAKLKGKNALGNKKTSQELLQDYYKHRRQLRELLFI